MRLLAYAPVLLLAACGIQQGEQDPAATQAAPKETVFDPMTNQLDRVKHAAETLPAQRKSDLDQAIEADSSN